MTARVSLYGQGGSAAQGAYYDRSAVVAAQEAFVAAPAPVQQRPRPQPVSSPPPIWAGHGGGSATASSTPGIMVEDIEDDGEVYLTEAHREWEKHFLRRLAKRIHKLVCSELDRSEEALFMLFVSFDTNLDGVIFGEEASRLLQALERSAPGALADGGGPTAQDGSVSFAGLLRWFSGTGGKQYQDTTAGFNFASLFVGVVGSGVLQNDARLEGLDWVGLRRNILGYRRLLLQLRQLQEERALAAARASESSDGLEAAMPLYYAALAREFEGDAEHLFELFSEVDEAGNMLLETEQVTALLRLLDTGASEADLQRYVQEINLTDGPLTFASLVDWWDQARSVPNSLVAEKGTVLIASVKASSAGKRLSGLLFSETAVQRRWRTAKEEGRLQALRLAYCRTLGELREYKMERDLRAVEQECAVL